MIQLSAVHKAFGARILFDRVTWQVRAGERIGLCGPNGAGKTTLLRIMAGLDEPDTGTLARTNDLTVGFLPQDGIAHAGRTLFEEASSALAELMTLDRMCPNFAYIPIVSRPDEETAPWGGESGYVQDLWERRSLDRSWGFSPSADDTHIFLCGNPSMIESMADTLQHEGFQEHTRKKAGEVHVERYW